MAGFEVISGVPIFGEPKMITAVGGNALPTLCAPLA